MLDVKNEYNQHEKEIILKIRHANFGIVGPNDWTDIIWKVYNDLTVDIEKIYEIYDKSIENINTNISKKDYNKILENIELYKVNNIAVEACDGSAWEIIQYENGKEIWKKDLGYIYGIKPLEEIENIVTKLL